MSSSVIDLGVLDINPETLQEFRIFARSSLPRMVSLRGPFQAPRRLSEICSCWRATGCAVHEADSSGPDSTTWSSRG